MPRSRPVVAPLRQTKPALAISGTRAHECPNGCISAHIRTHSPTEAACGAATKPLQPSIFAVSRGRRLA
jgi:hypothetical protein